MHYMNERMIRLAALLPLLWVGALCADDAGRGAIDELVRDTYANSPELRAAFSRWEATVEQIPQARSLPDPRIGYGYYIQQMDATQQFWLEQRFPMFGKRTLRAGVSEGAAAVAEAAVDRVAADLRREMLDAVANWVLVLRSTQLVEQNLNLVRQLEQVALQRYQAAEVSQADVLRLQMELDSLKVELQYWFDRRPAVQARLNAIRGRDPDYPVPEIYELPLGVDGGMEAVIDSLTGNPDLRMEQNRIQEAEQARQLARREAYPDITLGVEYVDNRNSFPDEVLATVSIDIPIWQDRYRAMRRQANANLRAAEADYTARLQRLQAEQRMAYYEERDARRRVQLFAESLIPRARQALGILESGYKAGTSGFLDLLEAQRALLELELASAKARSDWFIRRAELERIVGPFPKDTMGLLRAMEGDDK